MNIYFVIGFLAIVCIQISSSNTYYTATFFKVISLVSNVMIEHLHIPNAFGETLNDLQKHNITGTIDYSSSNNSIKTVESNNNAVEVLKFLNTKP